MGNEPDSTEEWHSESGQARYNCSVWSEIMTITFRKACWQRVTIVVICTCIVVPGWLAAQTDAGKNTPKTSAQTATDPAVAARAHDDSYVIGADDILAVSVWKEP